MRQRAWSLRWIIGGTYFVLMVLLLVPLAAFLWHQSVDAHMNTVRETRRGQARLAASQLADATATLPGELSPADRKSINTHMTSIRVRSGARAVFLLNTRGNLVAAYPPGSAVDPSAGLTPEVRAALDYDVGANVRRNPTTDEDTLYTAAAVRGRSRNGGAVDTRAVLVLASDLTSVQSVIGGIQWGIGLAFIGVTVLLLGVVIAVTHTLVQPLSILSAAAERFAGGELQDRVIPTGAAEIASLGDSFNRMAERLRRTITRLNSERAQAEAVLTSMVDGLIVTDTERRIRLINHSAELFCGLNGHEAIGRTLSEALLPYQLDDLLAGTLETGLPQKLEVAFSHPADRIAEVHMAPVEVAGQVQAVVIVLYDVTQTRMMEQVHKDFVANVSHELRTPVASVRAMAETIADAGADDDPEMTREFLGTIIGETERLTALLDDLLQLARMESGHRLIAPELTDISEVVRHVTQRVIAPIAAKDQSLILDLPDALEALVDRAALIQVLVNLLDNARKYSPEGAEITVRAYRDGDDLRIALSDTGIGIPEFDQTRIFERFYRVDKARSRAQGGTGLGLAIVRQLVELHGGRIMVVSEPEVGSTFTVILPQPQAIPTQD